MDQQAIQYDEGAREELGLGGNLGIASSAKRAFADYMEYSPMVSGGRDLHTFFIIGDRSNSFAK
jgi:hypothetical protein